MKKLTPATLDALEAALAKATPGEWSVTLDDTTYYDTDDGPCDVVIPEINRQLHNPEWADPEDFKRDVANAESIVAAHNALIAEVRLTVPEVIGEKHKNGKWWQIYSRTDGQWMYARWRDHLGVWRRMGDGDVVDKPIYALPMPEAPNAQTRYD